MPIFHRKEITEKRNKGKEGGKVAYLFPGQYVEAGMGFNLWKISEAAAKIFFQFDCGLGRPLSRLCFLGPEEELWKITNAQIASMAVSLACLGAIRQLKREGAKLPSFLSEEPDIFGGHSSGYITALVASGALLPEDGIKLIRRRAGLMDKANRANRGKMLPLIVDNAEEIKKFLQERGLGGNHNSLHQIVASGPLDLVDEVVGFLDSRKVKKLKDLKLKAGCHSFCMKSVKEELAEFLESLLFNKPNRPIVGNSRVQMITTAEGAKQEVLDQFDNWVLWHPSMQKMVNFGVATFIEIGWGSVLSNNLKRDFRNIEIFSGVNEIEKAFHNLRRRHLRQLFRRKKPAQSLTTEATESLT